MKFVFTQTGGARIGRTNSTWPFVTLKAQSGLLQLQAKLLGTYQFLPEEVEALIPYTQVPVLGEGVRIVHNKPDYPEKIIFWTFGNPQTVIEQVEKSGFQVGGQNGPPSPELLAQLKQQQGLPFKPLFWIITIGLFSFLFMINVSQTEVGEVPLGPFSAIAFGSLMVISAMTLFLKPFQRWALKPDREIGPYRLYLWMLGVIGPALLLVASLLVR